MKNMIDENNPAQLFIVTVSILGLTLTAGFLKVSTPQDINTQAILGASTDYQDQDRGDVSIKIKNSDSLKYSNEKGSSELGDIIMMDSTNSLDYNVTASYESLNNSSIVI